MINDELILKYGFKISSTVVGFFVLIENQEFSNCWQQAISPCEQALCQLCVLSCRVEVKEENTVNVIVLKLQLIYSTVRTSKYLLLSYAMSHRSAILLSYG